MPRLTPISPGVVHSSPNRTRLKSARWKGASADNIAVVKNALERVPGVLTVKPLPSGLVIEHENRPDIVENIGIALSDVSPVLLEHLLQNPDEDKHKRKNKAGHEKSLAEKLLDQINFDSSKLDFSLNGLSSAAATTASAATPLVKKAVPAILAGAGALMLLEGEALLAGVGPLALFYWAFDYNWKMNQSRTLDEISQEVETVAIDMNPAESGTK